MKLKAWNKYGRVVIDIDFTDDAVAKTIYDTLRNASTIMGEASSMVRMELQGSVGNVVALTVFAKRPYPVRDDRTPEEKEWSIKAKERLGFDAIVYKDGSWICDPRDNTRKIGYGNTPEEAIQDCVDLNN